MANKAHMLAGSDLFFLYFFQQVIPNLLIMFAVSSSIVLITVIKMQYATNREKILPL